MKIPEAIKRAALELSVENWFSLQIYGLRIWRNHHGAISVTCGDQHRNAKSYTVTAPTMAEAIAKAEARDE